MIPTDVYSEFGSISIGLYGMAIENDQIVKLLPTNLVNKTMKRGSYMPGQSPSDLPTPTQWDIYLQEIGRLASETKANEDVCKQLALDITTIKEDLEVLAQSASNSEEVCIQAKEDIEIIQDAIETLEANTKKNADYVNAQVKKLEDLDVVIEPISNLEIEAILNK